MLRTFVNVDYTKSIDKKTYMKVARRIYTARKKIQEACDMAFKYDNDRDLFEGLTDAKETLTNVLEITSYDPTKTMSLYDRECSRERMVCEECCKFKKFFDDYCKHCKHNTKSWSMSDERVKQEIISDALQGTY